MTRDAIYSVPQDLVADFAFDESVTRVFPDMIRRSVPGYGNIVTLIGLFAERYAMPGTTLYDLGCSLGAATLSMRRCLGNRDCTIVAVDSSPAMVEGCRANIAADGEGVEVDVRCEDIRDVAMSNTSVAVLNFTLQFLAPEQRLELLRKIRESMLPGGVLILSEKIHFADADEDEFQRRMHHDFKRANGYSDLEISQKRTALENVLVTDTLEQHRQRLADAGFARSHLWFQSFNFISLAAFA